MRVNSENNIVKAPVIIGEKHSVLTQALTGTLTMSNDMPDMLKLSCTAGQNVVLPAPDATNGGRVFYITNNSGGAFSLTVKDGATTIGTVAQNKTSAFMNMDGLWVAFTGA